MGICDSGEKGMWYMQLVSDGRLQSRKLEPLAL
jgi:hypothetical protein